MAPSLIHDTLALGQSEGFPDPSSFKKDKFHQLVDNLNRILGPSSGLTSDDVDVQLLRQLMEDYASKESDWQKYAFADLGRGYTRNLVDHGNGKSNLLVLVWTPGKGSPIHDHADAHCLMKVLKGTLIETRYTFPEAAGVGPKAIKSTVYKDNEVTYMSDKLGVHRISNPDPEQLAVSLHLYTPPNAAKEGCNIFNEETGARSHVTQSNFYSIFGCKAGN